MSLYHILLSNNEDYYVEANELGHVEWLATGKAEYDRPDNGSPPDPVEVEFVELVTSSKILRYDDMDLYKKGYDDGYLEYLESPNQRLSRDVLDRDALDGPVLVKPSDDPEFHTSASGDSRRPIRPLGL